MKRILMSASAIVFVAALAYGATGAFFSDTETSSGNTFTAGSIDLTVDSTSHYNGNVCVEATSTQTVGDYVWNGPSLYPAVGSPCNGTWTATNLGASNQFFSFADVKPGDSGEDTVSLHIDSNPAWACLDIGTNANNENGANEPELSAGDTTANGPADGELAGNISVIGWHDNGAEGNNGNNIWDADETALFPQTTLSGLNATTTLALADSITGTPLDPTITNNIGLAWCAGTFTASGPGVTPVCDGSSMGNITQTDSATSTVSFRVEQFRNNPNFTCGGEVTPPPANLYFQGFESGGDTGWTNFSVNIPLIDTHVPSGTGGIPAADGSFFATTTGDAFTNWGGYSSIFPVGGYTTEVKVYLDMNQASNDPSDTGYFDFTSAINNPGGTHRRDFVFHVGHNPATGNWSATVSNNSSDDSTLPQADQPQITGTSPAAISTTGWYTLQSYFHDIGGGVLGVTMNLRNSGGTVIGTWNLSDPSDIIGSTVGGNRYGWFSAQPFSSLPFDSARMYLGAPN